MPTCLLSCTSGEKGAAHFSKLVPKPRFAHLIRVSIVASIVIMARAIAGSLTNIAKPLGFAFARYKCLAQGRFGEGRRGGSCYE